ncbi:DUF3331 domain-containing protein [Burkholderia multivorans]|uniref:DUF3331 domain-containing protein n=1 Tax=Burkholderia multivorans TaxID=87883 RepID=UPI000B5A6B6E
MNLRRRREKNINDPLSLTVDSIPASKAYGNVHVKILEKSSDRLLLQWREPGRCNYSEQIWMLKLARKAGVCAYSGLLIEVGDSIYTPVGRHRPSNHGSMILAERVADVPD